MFLVATECLPERTQVSYSFMMDMKAPSFQVLSISLLLLSIVQASLLYVARMMLLQRVKCL